MTALIQPVASPPRTLAVRAEALLSSVATPLLLGVLQAAVCLILTFVELAEPPARPGFAGLSFSNAINSPGAWNGLLLFQDAFAWLPGIEVGAALSPAAYLGWRRSGIVLLALLQILALYGCLNPTARHAPASAWRWLVGPLLGSIALLPYPPINTDVFYYAASGRIAAIGENPYLTAPLAIPDEPFTPFNDWARITTPYGPVWTTLSRAVYAVSGDDPVQAVIGFKILTGCAALGLALVSIPLAQRLTGNRAVALAAGVVVGWQPALLLESAGTAHLDAVMMLLAVGGLAVIATNRPGGVRAGLLLLAASALAKPVTIPLLGLAALGRLWAPASLATILRRWLIDIAAILGLAVAMFAPYWSGGDLARELVTQGKLLYVDEPFGVNPFWYWVLPRTPGIPNGEGWIDFADLTLRPVSQSLTVLLLAWSLIRLLRAAWSFRRRDLRAEPGDAALPAIITSWAIAAATLALLPVNAHAWYAIWAVAPVALAWSRSVRARGFGSRWLWLYLAWSLAAYLIYHTVVWPGETG